VRPVIPRYWAENLSPAAEGTGPAGSRQAVSRPVLGGLLTITSGARMKNHHIPELLEGREYPARTPSPRTGRAFKLSWKCLGYLAVEKTSESKDSPAS
jgi:hypothetical protein